MLEGQLKVTASRHTLVRLYFSLYSGPAPPWLTLSSPRLGFCILFPVHTVFLHWRLASPPPEFLSSIQSELLYARLTFAKKVSLHHHPSTASSQTLHSLYAAPHTHLSFVSFSLQLSQIWFRIPFPSQLQTPCGKEQYLTFFSENWKIV